MISSAKEAREIMSRGEPHFQFECDLWSKWFEAKTYLAALEGPEVRALVEALGQYKDAVDHREIITKIFHCYRNGEKALSLYREAVKK